MSWNVRISAIRQPADLIGPEPTFATIDVSFISLKLILPALGTLLRSGSQRRRTDQTAV